MKKILITGASGGIGSAITEKFLNFGFSMILTSSSIEGLTILKKKYGNEHFYYILNFNEKNLFEKSLKQISD